MANSDMADAVSRISITGPPNEDDNLPYLDALQRTSSCYEQAKVQMRAQLQEGCAHGERLRIREDEFLLRPGQHPALAELANRMLKERVESMQRREDMLDELVEIERLIINGRRRRRNNTVPEIVSRVRTEETSTPAALDLCAIDLDEIKVGNLVCRLPCLHVFHEDCIRPHLLRHDEPYCPIDRTPINKDDIHRLPVWTLGTH